MVVYTVMVISKCLCSQDRTEKTGDRPHFTSVPLKEVTGSMAPCLGPGSLLSFPSYPVIVPDPPGGKRVIVVKNI